MSISLVGGYQDTRGNDEDFALTPFLPLVYYNGKHIKVFGIGLCWGFYSVYIGIGINIPKELRFQCLTPKKEDGEK